MQGGFERKLVENTAIAVKRERETTAIETSTGHQQNF
jgi:hypothetical protein